MTALDDTSLLNAWVRDGSEEAFGVLARRYAGLLYHAGLRQTGSPELAQEAAQNTLAILARKSARVCATPSLAPWLHRTACYEASRLLRREVRHTARMKNYIPPDDGPDPWAEAAPILDAALNDLPEPDRRVLLLKYVDGWTFEQMSERLGGESATWRKRGSRAVDQLRRVFAGKGVVLSTTVIASGLNTALTQAAPAAIATSLASGSLTAATSLSWKTLTLHTLLTMNIKPAALTLAIALAAMVPLGFQLNAVVDTKSRVQAHTTSVNAFRKAAGTASESIARSSGSAVPQRNSNGPASAREDAGGVDLMEWADLFSRGEPTGGVDMAKYMRIYKTLMAQDADSLEDLVLAAEQLDLPPAKSGKLINMLLEQLQRKAPAAAVPLYVRLMDKAGPHRMNFVLQSGSAMNRWVQSDPEAAQAWFAKAQADGALGSKSLDNDPSWRADTILNRNLVAGLMKIRPEAADRALQAMPPKELAATLNAAGGGLDPNVVLRYVRQLPAELQTQALTSTAQELARKDLGAAAKFVKSTGLPDRDIRLLMVDAARQILNEQGSGGIDYAKASERSAWLRREAPEGHADKAVGAFLGNLAVSDLSGAMRAYDKEVASLGEPNPVFTGAFARQLGMAGPQHFQKAMGLVANMPPGEERERAERELGALPWANQASPARTATPVPSSR